MLTNSQIQDNYERSYALTLDLVRRRRKKQGFDPAVEGDRNVELAQSVLGSERLVRLIQTTPYDRDIYAEIINEETDGISRSLFPDVGKKWFVSIDKLKDDFSYEIEEQAPSPLPFEEGDPDAITSEQILSHLDGRISQQDLYYLSAVLTKSGDRDFDWSDKVFNLIDHNIDYLEERIRQMRRLYPGGEIFDQENVDVNRTLPEAEIIGIYKNIYLGIYARFPAHFLNHEPEKRCGVLTRFLIEEILSTDPLTFMEQTDMSDFAQNGLTNVGRFFNYSMARIIRNAYPDLLMPWDKAHVPEGFWSDPHNRKLAVRWLLEDRLGITRDELTAAIRRNQISKRDFVENGLSYVYIKHFRSVSGALREAFPELEPWELGSVPNSYWKDEIGLLNAIRAIRRVIEKHRIPIDEIPARIKSKEISRIFFKDNGLSTVFERIFNKNMFNLFNTAYPNRFRIWELGNVRSEYWQDLKNCYRASKWIVKKEGLNESDVQSAIEEKKITRKTFSQYGLGALLKKAFDNSLAKAFLPFIIPAHSRSEFLKDVELLHMVQRKIDDHTQGRRLTRWFQRPLLARLTGFRQDDELQYYFRLRKRIKKRLASYRSELAQGREQDLVDQFIPAESKT